MIESKDKNLQKGINAGDPGEDKAPFLKKWSNIYLLVLIILFSLIGLFYLFSISFR